MATRLKLVKNYTLDLSRAKQKATLQIHDFLTVVLYFTTDDSSRKSVVCTAKMVIAENQGIEEMFSGLQISCTNMLNQKVKAQWFACPRKSSTFARNVCTFSNLASSQLPIQVNCALSYNVKGDDNKSNNDSKEEMQTEMQTKMQNRKAILCILPDYSEKKLQYDFVSRTHAHFDQSDNYKQNWSFEHERYSFALQQIAGILGNLESMFHFLPTIDCFCSIGNRIEECGKFIEHPQDDFFLVKYDNPAFWNEEICWVNPPAGRDSYVTTINKCIERKLKGYFVVISAYYKQDHTLCIYEDQSWYYQLCQRTVCSTFVSAQSDGDKHNLFHSTVFFFDFSDNKNDNDIGGHNDNDNDNTDNGDVTMTM